MLEKITIKGFRKYKEQMLDNLGHINFIMGSNNVGKTSILESVYSWACGQNIIPFMNVPVSRGRYSRIQTPYWIMEEILTVFNDKSKLPFEMSFEGVWNGETVKFEHTVYPSDLLTSYDSSYKKMNEQIVPSTNEAPPVNNGLQLLLSGMQIQQPVLLAKWKISDTNSAQEYDVTSPFGAASNVRPYVTAKYVDVLAHTAITENVQIYGSLKREGILEEVVSNMQSIFPEISGIDMIPYPDGSQAPISIKKTDGTALPIYAYGDGVQRWFYILGAIELYKNSIICIDEIDVGIHPEAQEVFCSNLIKYAKRNNVQLFITTHNIEFLDHFLSVLDSDKLNGDDIRVITMRDNGEALKVRTLDASEAHTLRKEYNLEVR